MAINRSRPAAGKRGKPKSADARPSTTAGRVMRVDPTRTVTLRRRLAAELRKRFARLRLKVYRLVADEDAFGLRPDAHDPFVNVFCPTGKGGGIDPTCSPSGKGGSVSAKSIPGDWSGELEVLDESGEVLTRDDADAVRRMVRESVEGGDPLDGVTVRKATDQTKREEVERLEKAISEHESRVYEKRRRESLYTPEGLLPGHPDYVDPPARLYHATVSADAIRKTGFKSSDELGVATFGGSAGNLVSFTTKENAEAYRDALAIARRGARGELTDDALVEVGKHYGVSGADVRRFLTEREAKDSPEQRSFHALQRISMEGGKFPLFMGGSWPDHIRTAAEPSVVSIPSTGLKDIRYNPREREWRVGDYRGIAVNTRWRFQPDLEKLRSFRAWLRQQLKADVLTPDEDVWERYVREGYAKGAGRAFDDVDRGVGRGAFSDPQAKAPTSLPGVNPTAGQEFYRGGKEQFLRDSFARPVAPEKVKQLAGRAFDELEGVTLQMELRMTGVLADGLAQGKSPRDVARDLTKAVDVAKDRALVIAHTETIRAHAEGQLDALENLGVTHVGAAVEWEVTDDEKLCKLCRPLDGVVLTTQEARGLIPRHPRCRCAWKPAGVGEKPDQDRKDTKARIDAAVRESVALQRGKKGQAAAAAGRELPAVDWPGAGLKVSRKRPQGIINVGTRALYVDAAGRLLPPADQGLLDALVDLQRSIRRLGTLSYRTEE